MKRINSRIILTVCAVVVVTACTIVQVGGQLRPNVVVAPTAKLGAAMLGKLIVAPKLGTLTQAPLASFTAMGDVAGKIYGASSGKLAIIGDSGVVASSAFSIPVSKPSGLSVYTPGKLVVGDANGNNVFVVDPGSKRSAKLFALGELQGGRLMAADVLRNGELASLAFDGKFLFIGVRAGYSSSIFKVDPSTKTAVAQTWAPGPDPAAMQYFKGNLFVLDGQGQKLRRFDAAMKLSMDAIKVPVSDGKGIVIRENDVRVLSPSEKSITRFQLSSNALLSMQVLSPSIRTSISRIDIGVLLVPQKYAVLICGDVAESGFDEFWNDTVWMYKTLRNAGYSAANIYVLYGYGNDHACPNPNYQSSETVTDFAATPANVDMVLNGLKNGDAAHGVKKIRDVDSLFIWTFDHGGGGPTNSYLCLIGGSVTDTHFASLANALPYAKRAIYMQQCRSGGFNDNLSNSKTFVSSACRGSENAHRADAEKESFGGAWYHHGEYNYYIIGSIAHKYANGAACNADSNSNGAVSCTEAHVWNSTHENQSEIPQLADAAGVGTTFAVN